MWQNCFSFHRRLTSLCEVRRCASGPTLSNAVFIFRRQRITSREVVNNKVFVKYVSPALTLVFLHGRPQSDFVLQRRCPGGFLGMQTMSTVSVLAKREGHSSAVLGFQPWSHVTL